MNSSTSLTTGKTCSIIALRRISFFSSFVFPVLHSDENDLIGGTAGLLLELANLLAEELGGTLSIEKKMNGNFSTLDAVEGKDLTHLPSKHYKFVLTLPTHIERTSGACPLEKVQSSLQKIQNPDGQVKNLSFTGVR
ncbi:hypothetical protein A3D88_00685 [Candidatus Peribacteria bacterium RIFCSPHIGHO2_02_FULL_52_16]|nr:MAG: hypothetical protein A2706_00755 [Candidatus Peribacteria bacterium RIFCSPHIGHO2_01_FULL_51_35]OGJ61187.1 MAG: hypothetical protein A3D88_00685 [Candidatus Peribacteria bacterium RIFCSPHIGHO2_02_FULL_52_16]